MIKEIVLFLIVTLISTGSAWAGIDDPEIVDHDSMLMDHGGGHLMDLEGGMVMGQNTDTLPMSCKSIEDEVEITVRAGRKYAEKFPGTMFSFDNQEWRVEPCTKITFHFINEDTIRHQFMMHGLPKYIYKGGMFHLEITGPAKISGTLIVPQNDATYLVHCDIAQHMEKGMKGQVVVGNGGVPLPSIPGVTPYAIPDSYDIEQMSVSSPPPALSANISDTAKAAGGFSPAQPGAVAGSAQSSTSSSMISGMLVVGLAFGLLAAPLLAKKLEGISKEEFKEQLFKFVTERMVPFLKLSMQVLGKALQTLSTQIRKVILKT
ncbi:MAG: cupredoxin domain-containing protein [Methylococcales bacterium]